MTYKLAQNMILKNDFKKFQLDAFKKEMNIFDN